MEPGSFRELLTNGGLFARIVSHLPYPVAVFSPDGIMKTANFALLAELNLSSDDVIVGKHNVYRCEDEAVSAAVKRAFGGETVYLHDIRFPFKSFESANHPLHSFDAVVFPASEQNEKIRNVVILLLGHETRLEGD